MEANEFRKGNLVKVCTPNMTIMIPFLETRVQGITIMGELEVEHTLSKQGFKVDCRHVAGIDLIETVWAKLGFEKVQSGYSAIGYTGYDFVNYDSSFELAIFEDGYYYNTAYHKIKVQYVHTLQNLFFVLQEEEMDLKKWNNEIF